MPILTSFLIFDGDEFGTDAIAKWVCDWPCKVQDETPTNADLAKMCRG